MEKEVSEIKKPTFKVGYECYFLIFFFFLPQGILTPIKEDFPVYPTFYLYNLNSCQLSQVPKGLIFHENV